MKIKISRFSFDYWGDLYANEWNPQNPLPSLWENIDEIGTSDDKRVLTFKQYYSVENKYVEVIKHLIHVFKIKQLALSYRSYFLIDDKLKLLISTNERYHGIDAGFLFSINADEISRMVFDLTSNSPSFFTVELLVRLGLRRKLWPCVLCDANDRRNTQIIIPNMMYLYAESPNLKSLKQLSLPKGINVHEYQLHKDLPTGIDRDFLHYCSTKRKKKTKKKL